VEEVMGFLKKIGKTLGKLPGSKMLTKPINKLASKTPGMRGMPAAFGMGSPKPASPIGPSPAVMSSPPPMMEQPPPMSPEPQLQMKSMAGPMEQGPMDLPPQAPPPMMNPGGNLMNALQQRNSGIMGRRPNGIGPRFMG
jgi:hypothetical protein